MEILNQKLSEFEVVDVPTSLALQRLAKVSSVMMGIEAPAETNGKTQTMTIRAKDRSVRDLVNQILSADARYNWRKDDSIIELFPKGAKDPLLETVLTRFEVRAVNRDEAIRALLRRVEVKRTLRQTNSSERTLRNLPGASENNLPRFSVTMSNASVRSILNSILKASRSSNWLFFRYGRRKEYLSLTMQ